MSVLGILASLYLAQFIEAFGLYVGFNILKLHFVKQHHFACQLVTAIPHAIEVASFHSHFDINK